MTATTKVTPEFVGRAYQALGSGDMEQIKQYWADDIDWLVPGNHAMAGWYRGLDGFLGFMASVGRLSANSFNMETVTILTNDEYSADVTHNLGYRADAQRDTESPYHKLDIDVIHLLRWRDGKVIEGRGAIFGDGTTRFNQFWSQLDPAGNRVEQ
jgi:uncharacterized protein